MANKVYPTNGDLWRLEAVQVDHCKAYYVTLLRRLEVRPYELMTEVYITLWMERAYTTS